MGLCVVAIYYIEEEKKGKVEIEIKGTRMRMTVEQSQKFVTKLYVFFPAFIVLSLSP